MTSLGIVAVALLLGAAVRFWGLGSRALWLDESYSAWFSELGWASLWLDSPRYETHPPLYYSLLKMWRAVAGDDAAALRALSSLAGLLAIPVVAVAALALARLAPVRRPIILIAAVAALMALSPRLILIAQDARPYALLLAAYALALTCWLRLTISFRSHEHVEGRLADWIGLGIGSSLTLWLHFLGLLSATALFGALLLTAAPGATRQRWIRLAFTSLAVMLSYLPCLLMLLGRTGDWGSGWVAWEPSRFPGAFLDLFGFYQQTEIWTPVAARILFAALIAGGLRALWRSRERPLAIGFSLMILFPPLAAALISQLGHPVFVPRTLIALLAPAYLIAAYALATLSGRSAFLLGALTALVLLVNLAETLSRPSLEPWDEVAATIERQMKAGDVVWVYPNDTALPLGRALRHDIPITSVPAPFPALAAAGTRPAGSPAVVAVDGSAARRFASVQASRPGTTVWLLVRNRGLFDPDGAVAGGLAHGRNPGPARRWRDIDLYPLRPR